MITLSEVDRASLRAEIARRKAHIGNVLDFTDTLIARACDQQSQWADPAGLPGMMGVKNYQGLCFERETRRGIEDRDRSHDYDRYRVYRANPWFMIFSVYVPRQLPSGKTRADSAIVFTLFEGTDQDHLRKIITSEDGRLLEEARRLGIELPRKNPDK